MIDASLSFLSLLLPEGAPLVATGEAWPEQADVVAVLGRPPRAPGWRLVSRHLVLPTLGRPRWIVPEEPRGATITAIDLYRPLGARGRAAHATLRALASKGWLARLPLSRLSVLGRRAPLAPNTLERLLEGRIGGSPWLWGATPGTEGPFRKAAVRIMTADGAPLAHVKAGREAAIARVTGEAAMLERVAGLRLATGRAPRVLATETTDGWALLALEHLEVDLPRPVSDETIADFHVDLHGRTAVSRPLESGRFWQELEKKPGIAEEAFRVRCRELAGRSMPLGLAHGDLAPWNVHASAAGLLVFDWELATEEAPPLFDLCHWLLFVPLLLGRRTPRELDAALRGGDLRALLQRTLERLGATGPVEPLALVYLVDRIGRLTEEQHGVPTAERARQIDALGALARLLLPRR